MSKVTNQGQCGSLQVPDQGCITMATLCSLYRRRDGGGGVFCILHAKIMHTETRTRLSITFVCFSIGSQAALDWFPVNTWLGGNQKKPGMNTGYSHIPNNQLAIFYLQRWPHNPAVLLHYRDQSITRKRRRRRNILLEIPYVKE